MQKILKLVPELKRLRLSALDSIEADAALMQAIAEEERLMPHFHLSAQAGDDLILKRMKRRQGRADTSAFCAAVPRLRPAGGFSVDPALVYALTRLESNFDPAAISPAGARGLMQIMPDSALGR